MNASVTWTGLDAVLAALGRLPEQTLKAAGGFLYREGEAIIRDAKENYVPVDLGVLRDSGHVGLPQITGSNATVEIGFGGAAQDYAAIVHEDLEANHPNGGGAKYLELPLLQHAQDMASRMADDVRAELGASR